MVPELTNSRSCIPCLLACAFILALGGCEQQPAVDTPTMHVFVDATVWTGNPQQPFAEAVVVEGNRIAFVGSRAEAVARAPRAEVISAPGGLVVPGFIDSHVHFLTGGYRLSSVQLRDASTPEEFIRRIGAFAITLDPGEWIVGGDWDHERWGGLLPDRSWIDSVSADNPVWINRLDGHMALANSEALRLADADDPGDVSGGTVVRDGTGRITGVFKDNAMSFVDRAIPATSPVARRRALLAATNYVARQGVTSVHDVGGADGEHEALAALRHEDSLLTRVYLAYPLSDWESLVEVIEADGAGDTWLRVGAVKGFVDGSLGSHTAAFFEPFDDAPNDRGLLVVEPESLYVDLRAADRAGLQLMIHAIGDRANATLLDLYERLGEEEGARDRRSRIEHAQHVRREDIGRFAELGVIASMQPYHAIDDGRWADKVIGAERAQTTYAFRSLIDEGAHVAFGSDWFVAPPTPLEGIYAAVTRRTLDSLNEEGWVPEQKIDLGEALASYTREAAFAEFQEGNKGTIETGKLADIVVLNRNLFDVPAETIADTRVLLTMVDGDVVFREN